MNDRSSRVSGFALVGIALLVVAFVAAGLYFFWPSMIDGSGGKRVTVPELVGLERTEAEKLVDDAGLALGEVTEEHSDSVEQGCVISQSPSAGIEVDQGTKISLIVSLGSDVPVETTVPDLVGKTKTQAEQLLSNANLVGVEDASVASDKYEAGTVCEQSVKAGTKVAEGTQVHYTLAKAPETVAVPDLAGKTFDEAKKALEEAELKVEKEEAYDEEVAEGSVVSQSVPAGTKVERGTVVKLTVSKGKKPAEKVEVPDVAGMTATQAAAYMQAVGLKLSYDEERPDGIIDNTDPEAGAKIDEGSEVVAIYRAEPEPEPAPVGAWEVNGDAITSSLSADDRTVFDAAMQQMTGVDYEPIATLATQVVAGTRYAFLCRSTVVYPDAAPEWCVVGVGQGVDGSVSFLSSQTLDLAGVRTTNAVSGFGGMGGWTVDSSASKSIPSGVATALESVEGSVDPVAVIATQVVSGTNYRIICKGDGIYVAELYVDAAGNASLSSLAPLDWESYVD